MTEQTLISIITPVYNAEQYIEQTIQTILNQTYQNWELLLVDDCSTDQSATIIQRYQIEEPNRIQYHRMETNSGAAKSRNRGIEEAKGKYITFIDADDLWEPTKLARQIEFMKKGKYDFSCTSYEFADSQGKGNGKIAHVPASLTYQEALKNTIIFTSTVMFHMDKLQKEDIQMPDVKSEDTATWWKILKKGYTVHGIDEVLVYYRRPANSLSSNKLEAIKRIWFLYRKVEHLSIAKSFYNFMFYAVRTTLRRL